MSKQRFPDLEKQFDETRQALANSLSAKSERSMTIFADFDGSELFLDATGRLYDLYSDIDPNDFDELVLGYALQKDRGFRKLRADGWNRQSNAAKNVISPSIIEIFRKMESGMPGHGSRPDEEIAGSARIISDEAYDAIIDPLEAEAEAAEQRYLEENYERLLQGLVLLMQGLLVERLR